MAFYFVPNLLRLSLGLSVPLLLFRSHAQVSVSAPEPQPVPSSLTAQFEPTGSEPVDTDTVISTTGGRYFQPRAGDRDFRGTRTTTGTRSGSCSANGSVFSGLGPRSVTGLTTSSRPEFVWYMTDAIAESPMLFRLLALDENGQASLVDSAELSAQAGFMRYQLPDSVPPLEEGKDYLWQVIVRCDPNRMSSFLTSTLPLQVVAPTPELTATLATATTDAEKAITYGNAGVWYNAMALVSAGTSAVDKDVRTGLLQDLADLESNDEAFSSILLTIVDQTSSQSAP